MTLAALGVVYGDIGTSPLYAIKEVFGGAHHPVPITPDNVLGILSLVFWSLMIVVTLKYVAFIMRADNKGEGGIMALMALALRNGDPASRRQRLLIALGLFGAALFYGDGVITPAISVLSAVEGLEVITPAFKPYVIPITLVDSGRPVLHPAPRHGQRRHAVRAGDAALVRAFWRCSACINYRRSTRRACGALNPVYGRRIPARQSGARLSCRSARSCWCVTGGEALYADMGHFGRQADPARLVGMVLPALLLNYFGQGALLLDDPAAIENPFYLLAPDWALYPLVILATVATVIASQAVISGAFSITQQAIQLGYTAAPRGAAHLGAARSARSTCRPSTGCCWLRSSRWCSASARRAIWRRPTASPSPAPC